MKKIWQSSFSFHYPPNGKMPVRMWWQIFQTWINYQILGFSLQLEWICWSIGVGRFISPQDGNLQCWKLARDFRRCYILFGWDFLRKEKGKYTVTLINRSYLILSRIQQEVVLLILRTVFAVGFRWLSFLQLKLWERIYPCRYEVVRRQLSSICVSTFTNVLLLHFKVNKFDQQLVQRVQFYRHDWLPICRYKTREFWGLFAEVREKSVFF